MVQIMGGQQAGGQCLPIQNHTHFYNGVNHLHQTEYAQFVPDASNHSRHHIVQVCSALTFFYYLFLLLDRICTFFKITTHEFSI